ncbi:hypothetical protein [uncultured Sphingomonas sp.]|uniref:hypothetical protein n=1 Tax=uncultured Sphingomonas sp. TaxID=158754 RepID=UPI0025FC56B0|nr:hypothetical protein [uncultured Sphingomonas sp.]
MILVALLIVQTTAPAPAVTDPAPEEITVAAERLKRFRAIMRKDRKSGEMRCLIKRQSGDAALDKGICDAMLACAPKIEKDADIQPCMAPAISALLPRHKWIGRRSRGL